MGPKDMCDQKTHHTHPAEDALPTDVSIQHAPLSVGPKSVSGTPFLGSHVTQQHAASSNTPPQLQQQQQQQGCGWLMLYTGGRCVHILKTVRGGGIHHNRATTTGLLVGVCELPALQSPQYVSEYKSITDCWRHGRGRLVTAPRLTPRNHRIGGC